MSSRLTVHLVCGTRMQTGMPVEKALLFDTEDSARRQRTRAITLSVMFARLRSIRMAEPEG